MRRLSQLALILLTSMQLSIVQAQTVNKTISRVGVPTAMQDFDAYQNQQFNPLFDAGSWHGFLLPDRADYAGSFAGPLVVFEEYSLYLADALERFQIHDTLSGKILDPALANWSQYSAPGQLTQSLSWDKLRLHLDLHFINASDAIVRYRIENLSREPLQLSWEWQGKLMTSWDKKQTVAQRFPNWKTQLFATSNGVKIRFGKQRDMLNLMTSGGASYRIVRSLPAHTTVAEQSYQSQMNLPPIAAGSEHRFYSIYRYHLDEDVNSTANSMDDATTFAAAENLIRQAQQRWARWQAKLPASGLRSSLNSSLNSSLSSNLSTKAFETLIANWRAPAGKVQHDMLVPSTTARWFNGAWAWDSWKHAYALAAIEPRLGKNVMRSMFDYQIRANDVLRPQDAGMLIDTVFYNQDPARGGDGDHWNERNSKPPLAAWAVWELFQHTYDKNWLREMRPQLEAYHAWWYRNRDHDQNGLIEYGATVHPTHTNKDGQLKFTVKTARDPALATCSRQADGRNGRYESYQCEGIAAYEHILSTGAYESIELPVQEAAAYESGMDNAARFGFIDAPALQRYADRHYQGDLARARADWQVRIFENRDPQGQLRGYSINQESVDLNAFLYHEKVLLARIADVLKDSAAAREWRQQARVLKRKIQSCFFDPESGFFYDRQIDTGSNQGSEQTCRGRLLTQRGRGPEGWAPLWAGAASQQQAKAVMRTMMNPTEFFTEVPLPTAALSNPAYDPESYWRGRVWLDQVYFAIIGLRQYGYYQQAQQIQQKLMSGAMGLQGDAAIRENYHPRTGRMQGASNFSWSAAHLLMLGRLPSPPKH